jgi:hypothetical protein
VTLVAERLGVVALDPSAHAVHELGVRIGDVDLAVGDFGRGVTLRPRSSADRRASPCAGGRPRSRRWPRARQRGPPPTGAWPPAAARAESGESAWLAARARDRDADARRAANPDGRASSPPPPAARLRAARHAAPSPRRRWRWPHRRSCARAARLHCAIAVGDGVDLGAIDRDHAHRRQARVRAQRQHFAEEVAQRPLVTLDDRAIVA